ncbi:MAG: sugar phosphate isomerase/epimerase [Bryobacteraceae bacterium]|nr:sugar phosphate isomerase/epimerase [Bryobacteraceae bacterium]
MMTRRELGKTALAALPASSLLAKPDSKFFGVQIGAITYSFRSLPSTADHLLKYCVELGLSSIELMSDPAEAYAGIPPAPPRPAGPGRKGGGRVPLSPEQQAAARKAAEDRTKWRLSASMDKYKELRARFSDAGVKIEIFKLALTEAMSDEEYDYVFTVTRALGASCVTMELPAREALSKRIGQFAARHKIFAGYHNHMQVNASSWDTALSQSSYNSINLDVGHFSEAISASPVPFIREKASRITSFHLKDKKFGTNGGGNVPWGTGQTGLREILQLMKKEKYRWPANIELEYNVPEGSSVMTEMAKCVQFCKDALS